MGISSLRIVWYIISSSSICRCPSASTCASRFSVIVFAVKCSMSPLTNSTSYSLESRILYLLGLPTDSPSLSFDRFLIVACSRAPSLPRGKPISIPIYSSPPEPDCITFSFIFSSSSSGISDELINLLYSARKSSSSYYKPIIWLGLTFGVFIVVSAEGASILLLTLTVKASIFSFISVVTISNYGICRSVLQDIGNPEAGNIQYDMNGPVRWETPSHCPNFGLSTSALDLYIAQS